MAASSIYRVVFSAKHRKWTIKNGEGDASPWLAYYRERDEAVLAGQRAARANAPSRLVVHQKDGAIEAEWTYDMTRPASAHAGG